MNIKILTYTKLKWACYESLKLLSRLDKSRKTRLNMSTHVCIFIKKFESYTKQT